MSLYFAQSPTRDPIQALQPQFFSSISCKAPTPSQHRRAFFNRTQQSIDSNNRSRTDFNFRSTASRKRSRIEVKEEYTRPSIDPGLFNKGSQDNNNLEMKFNEYEISDAAHHCGYFSPSKGCQRRNQLSSDSPPYPTYDIPRKSARVTSRSFGGILKSPFDEFSQRLGVGWSSVLDADLDVQAAVRGWATFIENHFPVTNVNIRLRSKGLNCFLVEANEGYYLFGDDLKQGKLVSKNLGNVWTNLQGPVPVFEGETLNRSNDRSKIQS
ncbi:hypothetical protein OnM2_069041 [Erysiphe neolycopersici]|uniref:Uncharacterized protein n=1 Tax=Erysiphe neolycopersici TaxID=212602 RepID=A0A420HL65_9PEZI|nr:hypothetical protein OnM2_069041 [Erysiphe neolycopersici]